MCGQVCRSRVRTRVTLVRLMACGQVRGATAHFDAVVGAATSGVLGAAADSGVPVVFCVMTTDTMEQARSIERAAPNPQPHIGFFCALR